MSGFIYIAINSFSIKKYCDFIKCISILCLFFFEILFSGCSAQFHLAEHRTVLEGSKLIGPVADSLVGYKPLEIISYPTESSLRLQVSLKKVIETTYQYETSSYEEAVHKRQPSKIENHGDDILLSGSLLTGAFAAVGLYEGEFEEYLTLGAALSALMMGAIYLQIPNPPTEIQNRKIAGSNKITYTYRKRRNTYPANNEAFRIGDSKTVRTNSNGIATIQVSPSRYDSGITIYHIRSGDEYFIQRIKKERIIEANWTEAIRLLKLPIGTSIETVKLIQNRIARASIGIVGLKGVVIAITLDILTGEIIDFVIDTFGSVTEEYYVWTIKKTR